MENEMTPVSREEFDALVRRVAALESEHVQLVQSEDVMKLTTKGDESNGVVKMNKVVLDPPVAQPTMVSDRAAELQNTHKWSSDNSSKPAGGKTFI